MDVQKNSVALPLYLSDSSNSKKTFSINSKKKLNEAEQFSTARIHSNSKNMGFHSSKRDETDKDTNNTKRPVKTGVHIEDCKIWPKKNSKPEHQYKHASEKTHVLTFDQAPIHKHGSERTIPERNIKSQNENSTLVTPKPKNFSEIDRASKKSISEREVKLNSASSCKIDNVCQARQVAGAKRSFSQSSGKIHQNPRQKFAQYSEQERQQMASSIVKKDENLDSLLEVSVERDCTTCNISIKDQIPTLQHSKSSQSSDSVKVQHQQYPLLRDNNSTLKNSNNSSNSASNLNKNNNSVIQPSILPVPKRLPHSLEDTHPTKKGLKRFSHPFSKLINTKFRKTSPSLDSEQLKGDLRNIYTLELNAIKIQ